MIKYQIERYGSFHWNFVVWYRRYSRAKSEYDKALVDNKGGPLRFIELDWETGEEVVLEIDGKKRPLLSL